VSYQYPATDEERAAAALLRSKGWSVGEPTCPLCNGWGSISKIESWGIGAQGTVSISGVPCPNGCPRPTMTLSTSSSTQITADGTVGMRRGVS
jgi:hypothetical protein